MGYYDQKINASMLSNGSSQNNSILLPELKSVTPQIHNIKQPSISGQGAIINRKKSVERVGANPSMVVDSPHGGGG